MTPEQQKLVLDNDRIVYSTLKRFNIPSYEYNDYKQEGLLALCRAAVNFNPEIGKFSTYAFRYVYNSLQTYKNKRSFDKLGIKESRMHQDMRVASARGDYYDFVDFNVVSIEQKIAEGVDDENNSLEHLLGEIDSSFDDVEMNIVKSGLYDYFKANMSSLQYKCMKYVLDSTQGGKDRPSVGKVASVCGCSPSYVVRTLQKANKLYKKFVR